MIAERRPTLFCFGLGFCATRLAQVLAAEGWRIIGTSRAPGTVERLRAQGVEAHHFDRQAPLVDAAGLLAEATHLLSSIPPDALGDPVLDLHGSDVAALRPKSRDGAGAGAGRAALEWIGYLSSTGVYGDRGGAMVDESSALAPTGERGRRRVAAEARWRALHAERGLPVQVFRLAGIYGPGRNALDQLRAGTARRIRKPGHLFSRIHVDDVVAVLRASMARAEPGFVYNVCDDESAPAEAVIAYAAELLGLPAPPLLDFDAAGLAEATRSFYADNKRVDNRRIKERLGVRLRYPNYRQGLRALAGV